MLCVTYYLFRLLLLVFFFISFLFFFNDTATTEIYTLSLHDALPISVLSGPMPPGTGRPTRRCRRTCPSGSDRKSTRLNSSHANISYAVFCLKKKKKKNTYARRRQTRKHATPDTI